jgi:hypothetical protein
MNDTKTTTRFSFFVIARAIFLKLLEKEIVGVRGKEMLVL